MGKSEKFKMNTPVQRLVGTLPAIGIRPVIDGRRQGVRESLEVQTMNMAKAVAGLLTENIKHPNGLPVECVIADSTIGRVTEAAQCAEKFARMGVGASITVTPCWCYGTEVMDADPLIPKAVWGFNGTERPGAVYLAATLAGYAQKGLPVFGIYGRDVQNSDDNSIPDDVREKLLKFAKAGLAVAEIKNKSYLSMGSVSMGIAGSAIDHAFFSDWLGMRTESVDMSEFIRRIERKIYDEQEYENAMLWVKNYCKEGEDLNKPENRISEERKKYEWETVVKMTMIARDLMIGNSKLADMGFGEEADGFNALISGFQGQRQWTDHFPNGDFMEAILNSSFDWNGIRQPFLVATENDTLNGVSMAFGNLLTDTAQIFSDVRTFWSPDAVKRVTGMELTGKASGGIIHLINSGSTTLDATGRMKYGTIPAMKPFRDITDDDVQECLDATVWSPADQEYFRGGGFSSNFNTDAEMPVTMCRINIIKGIGPVIQIAEGFTVILDSKIHKVLDKRTNPTWPTTWFVPVLTGEGAFTDVYSVMANWGANHGAISYGHIGDKLITLASMLRIPVNMHNVAANRIFRPAAWSMFGTKDMEGADFRACKNYGPLYG